MDIKQQLAAIESQLVQAAEAYKSGQVASRPALAKVKRLARQKVNLQLALAQA